MSLINSKIDHSKHYQGLETQKKWKSDDERNEPVFQAEETSEGSALEVSGRDETRC